MMKYLICLIMVMGVLPAVNFGQPRFDFPAGTGHDHIILKETLVNLDAIAARNPKSFIQNLVTEFRVPEREVIALLEVSNLTPADVYLALELARLTGILPRDVLTVYNQKRGWGATAQQLGIKPGSNAFFRLKNSAQRQFDILDVKEKKQKKAAQKAAKKKNRK